jgi:hypothetical protein
MMRDGVEEWVVFGIVNYDSEEFDGWWLIAMRDARCKVFLSNIFSDFYPSNHEQDANARCYSSGTKTIPLLSLS